MNSRRLRKWSERYKARGREPRTRRRRPTPVERLVERLQRLNALPVGYRFEFSRTRAGHWQRSAGAWSWSLWCEPEDGVGGRFEVGSQLSVGELLKLDDDKVLEWVDL